MAKDRAYHLNARRLSEMESHLREVYSQASRELQADWNAYMRRNQPKVDSLYQAYQTAKQSGSKEDIQKALEDYQKKLASVTYKDAHYRERVNALTDKLANVNKEALKYINGNTPYAASNGYNQLKDDIDKKMIPGIRWDIVNDDTVRLALQGKVKLPEKKLSIPKDKRWNKKKMNAELLQGILQGEDIPTIAKRLQKVTDMNRTSAIRNARTMMTYAENAGRQASYNRAAEDGMIIYKVWEATMDERTRETHEQMNGESVPYNEDFSIGYEFPGTEWNCRCTMYSDIRGFKDANGKIHWI